MQIQAIWRKFSVLHNIAHCILCILHKCAKNAIIRKKAGDPMAKGKYKDWLEPEKLTLLQGWRRDGLTYEQIASNMGIDPGTIYVWMRKHPEIKEALRKGEEVMVYEVENALYKSAVGYDVTETDQTETIHPDGSRTVTKHARKRHIPPSVGSICFILKNRRPSKYQDKPVIEDTTALEKLDAILKEAKENAVQQQTE